MITATQFIYDGVHSGVYGLLIADFNDSNIGENSAFSPSFSALKVPQIRRFFHGGVSYDAPQTFEFSIISKEIITAGQRSEILSWLIGRNSFKKFQFDHEDWDIFTYYCVFTNASTIYVNGECHGFRLTATFDSPYARGAATSVSTVAGTHTIKINNKSDIKDEYTYPVVEFTGESISIVNKTDDSNRAFVFEGLQSGETVTVDNETKIIKSSMSGEKLSNFKSKKWLRLKPGINELVVVSKGNVKITCPWYATIGY